MRSRLDVFWYAALAGIGLLAGCAYDQNYSTEPPGPVAVDVTFCAETKPAWIAFQDGDGAWKRVLPEVGERLATAHLSLSSARGTVAVARDNPSGISTLDVRYAATRELSVAGDQLLELCGISGERTLVGRIEGLAANQLAVVSSNRSTLEVVSPAHETNEFRLGSVTPGPQDILVTRVTQVADGGELSGFILRHSPELPDGAAITGLDFTNAEVFLPVSRQLTLTGLGDGAISRSGIRTSRGNDRVTSGSPAVASATRTYAAAPEALLGPGDLQFINANTTVSNTSNVERSVMAYFRSPVDRTLTFGAVPVAPDIAVIESSPALRYRAHLPEQPDYDASTSIVYQQGQTLSVSVMMTAGYEKLGGSYDLVIPDLTGVAGFLPRWSLQAGSVILWRTIRIGGLPANASPSNGAMRRIASDAGFLTG